uniref:Putative secreted protein n=1 Tax=Anopheles triannulatus TaxID=58253 RepID=A0A2M4B1K8_9DIPT
MFTIAAILLSLATHTRTRSHSLTNWMTRVDRKDGAAGSTMTDHQHSRARLLPFVLVVVKVAYEQRTLGSVNARFAVRSCVRV